MLYTNALSDQDLIHASHQWHRMFLRGSAKATDQIRRHKVELQNRFSDLDHAFWPSGHMSDKADARATEEPVTVTEAANRFVFATADSATRSTQALQDLLHNLRVVLEMDIAFVAEFVDAKKVYRHIDQANEAPACVKVGDSAALEITLCQRVVDGRLPLYLGDAQAHPEMANVKTTNASNIKAYLSAPVVLRDGRTYGTLCCISHTPRSALGSRQIDSLRYVAGIVANELEKKNH
ncbi:MAG: GAF domain-containing protein [Cytophagaceae bacterium]|nr:MAG: GAF domain-containing protein [Cytophagaceae bacterium]